MHTTLNTAFLLYRVDTFTNHENGRRTVARMYKQNNGGGSGHSDGGGHICGGGYMDGSARSDGSAHIGCGAHLASGTRIATNIL